MKFSWRKALIGLVAAIVTASAGLVYTLYTRADAAVESATSSGTLTDFLKAEPLNGEETGQVNILVAGNSADDAGHGGAELTDSIMVASINVASNKVTLISIPRDLWVTVDGSSMKLNAVYTVGGMEGLKSEVTNITGLTINHSVLVNYAAFRDMIDAVGGVDVTIDSSDPRGIYDPMVGFSAINGAQHLDGAQALLLARSRNDPTYDGRVAYGLPNGDFDRTANQRKIAEALTAKVASSSTLTNPSKLSALFSGIAGNVSSDFSVGQLRRLYDLSKTVTIEDVSINGTDDSSLLTDYTSLDGQSALVPLEGAEDYDAIQTYLHSVLYTQ